MHLKHLQTKNSSHGPCLYKVQVVQFNGYKGLEQLPIYMLCHILVKHYIAALMGHKVPTPSTAQADDTNIWPPYNDGVNGQANPKQKQKNALGKNDSP